MSLHHLFHENMWFVQCSPGVVSVKRNFYQMKKTKRIKTRLRCVQERKKMTACNFPAINQVYWFSLILLIRGLFVYLKAMFVVCLWNYKTNWLRVKRLLIEKHVLHTTLVLMATPHLEVKLLLAARNEELPWVTVMERLPFKLYWISPFD